MPYSDTQSFNLTAAGTTGPDVINALIAHFTAAPGRWEIKSGVSPAAGAALTIRRKIAPLEVGDINIRWDSSGYFWGAVDPDGTITASGNASTPPTMGSNASPEARTDSLGSINASLMVHEHDDCVTVLINNAAKTALLHGFHQGIGYVPVRANAGDFGLTGHVNLVGRPSMGSASGSLHFWIHTGTTTVSNQSRVRTWDTGGNAGWSQASTDQTGLAYGGSAVSPVSSDSAIKMAIPFSLRGNDVNGTNDLLVGNVKWLAAAPFDSTVFPAQLPRVRIQSPSLDEGWMYINETATATSIVVSIEKTFIPS